MTMITPSYLGETIEYSSLHACRSTLEDPTIFKFRFLLAVCDVDIHGLQGDCSRSGEAVPANLARAGEKPCREFLKHRSRSSDDETIVASASSLLGRQRVKPKIFRLVALGRPSAESTHKKDTQK